MIALLRLSSGSASVSEIAKATGLRKNGASVLVDRLVSKGVLNRTRSRQDRRVVQVHLTDAGKTLVTQTLQPKLGQSIREWLSPLSESEQELLLSFYERIADGRGR